MAWTNSKIFTSYITDIINNTTAMDGNTDTWNVTNYGTTPTPDQTVASASAAYNAGVWTSGNEVTATGWPAGGLALASVTSGFATNVFTFDAADRAGGATDTITAAFGCLVFDNTIATPVAKQAACYNYYGGSQTVTGGVFTIVWNASGIFTITV